MVWKFDSPRDGNFQEAQFRKHLLIIESQDQSVAYQRSYFYVGNYGSSFSI